MSDAVPVFDLESVRIRADQLLAWIEGVVAAAPSEAVRREAPRWNSRVTGVLNDSRAFPEVTVALVGGTGAGKSTLLNALLGARIVPVSSMRACTAAITTVGFQEASFSVVVKFVSRDSWNEELGTLTADLADYVAARGEASGPAPEHIRSAAADKIRAVYGETSKKYFETLDPQTLKEPAEIASLLDSGVVESAPDSIDKLRLSVRDFLDANCSYWPIVSEVDVRGPFSALADGATLIDLPGLNDISVARESVTKGYLQQSKYVWILFNMKRSLTRDVYDILKEGDLLRRLFMDGRANTLTFIGTGSDDFASDEVRDELGLPEDTLDADVARERSAKVRAHVSNQLSELASDLTRAAHESPDRQRELEELLHACPVFTISARDYGHLTGIWRNKNVLFEDEVATGVPDLAQHLRATCASYGVPEKARALHVQLDLITAEIEATIRAERNRYEMAFRAEKLQLEEVRAAAERASTFLDQLCGKAKEEVANALETSARIFSERLSAAATQAKLDAIATRERWEGMHWATMRAAARRQGRFAGATGCIDFPAQIAKPILDAISFCWVDFFGRELGNALTVGDRRLTEAIDQYIGQLNLDFGPVETTSEILRRNGPKVRESVRTMLHEGVKETNRLAQERIDAERRGFSEFLESQVVAEMKAAFDAAAGECGQGMKARMVEHLHWSAKAASEGLFDDLRALTGERVEELMQWITDRYTQLADNVRREASGLVSMLLSVMTEPGSYEAEVVAWLEKAEAAFEQRQ